MPGWMGMRGLVTKSVHDMERDRRDEARADHSGEMQRRAEEKVQEILRDQQGDMSAFTGGGEDDPSGGTADVCSLPLGKIMSSKVAVLSFDDSLLTVQGILAAVKFRHLPVVDDGGGIIGIVSDRDILRMASPFFGTVNEQTRDKEIMIRKIGTIMTRNPICGRPESTVLAAVKAMNSKKISCLPVVESAETRKLLGIVTWKDIVRAFCAAGFDKSGDSQRLRTGVAVKPVQEEAGPKGGGDAADIVPKQENEAVPPRPHLSYGEEANLASQRLAARVRAAREEPDPAEEEAQADAPTPEGVDETPAQQPEPPEEESGARVLTDSGRFMTGAEGRKGEE